MVGLLQEHGKSLHHAFAGLRYSFVQQPKGHEADGGRSMGEGDGSRTPPSLFEMVDQKGHCILMGLMSARVFEDVFDTVFLQQGLHGQTEIHVMDRPPASRAGLAGMGSSGAIP